jgi:hypothetical protein
MKMIIEQVRKLNTKNLLRFYKAERKRMFNRGYRFMVVDYDDNDNLIMGWYNTENEVESPEKFENDIDFLDLIKKELDAREHVNKK